ncbi:hypothetical protein BGI41_00625 [Methanobrevibacter sp. 87.7]|uniref:beta-ribofuranosylaminobenzene 5'-phosphate synthase n=1 Tax=Methanobrevibacter sp. 87.7 TaxID=387957 RepID=UPI000B513F14|nr:beta-ribofuranosylaminobenzene 5'-phosphate synthase [Methanobrevibacter sp. 87.7]OWT33774.1 hypothetical protein BGI41_00625 [Methanobrevibacter sp. 87.7]
MIIKTPSRLHMALINMDGSNGRMDGGIGLTLDRPNFILEGNLSDSSKITVDFEEELSNDIKAEYTKKINDAANKILNYYDFDYGFDFLVKKSLLLHSGLGSGTQIALATAKIVTELLDIHKGAVVLSTIVGRGGTSGIGTYSFDFGGFLVDGGHNKDEKPDFLPSSASAAKPPKLIARYDFPEDWNILIAIPKSDSVNGKHEVNVFQEACPVPSKEVNEISHIIFMNLIPFMLEKDIIEVGRAVNEMQYKGFNKVGIDIQNDKTKDLMKFIYNNGAYGVGISSFGPALYSFFDDNNKDIVEKTKEYLGNDGIVFVSKAQNHGYEIL